jgi:hypothetical protein
MYVPQRDINKKPLGLGELKQHIYRKHRHKAELRSRSIFIDARDATRDTNNPSPCLYKIMSPQSILRRGHAPKRVLLVQHGGCGKDFVDASNSAPPTPFEIAMKASSGGTGPPETRCMSARWDVASMIMMWEACPPEASPSRYSRSRRIEAGYSMV